MKKSSSSANVASKKGKKGAAADDGPLTQSEPLDKKDKDAKIDSPDVRRVQGAPRPRFKGHRDFRECER